MLAKTIKGPKKVDLPKEFDSRLPVVPTSLYLKIEFKIYNQLLELRARLLKYISGDQFDEKTNFAYFLNQYIRRQIKTDAEFASEIGVTDAAISQYINNRRKPTPKFIIRLELHSDGIFQAIYWLKLLQKEKEWEIMTNQALRMQESEYVRKRLKVKKLPPAIASVPVVEDDACVG